MVQLYTNEGRDISDGDFVNALRQVGVVPGDVLFVHSDIKAFGRPILGDQQPMKGIIDALQMSVRAEGTIVMPTFTYSFCKGEVYDRKLSRSTVGSLTEFFRTQPEVVRNQHPIFSVAAWGKYKDRFSDIGKDSLGANTAFELLTTLNAKIIFLGVTLGDSCTFLHHVEQMHAVPYRYMKSFSGTVIDGQNTYEDVYTYFVRKLDGSAENDLSRIEPVLRNEGLLAETKIGNSTIGCIGAKSLFEAGMRYLDTDPEGLLQIKK